MSLSFNKRLKKGLIMRVMGRREKGEGRGWKVKTLDDIIDKLLTMLKQTLSF